MKTTKEYARTELREELIKNLESLLEKNLDAEKGYKRALQHAETSRLKAFIKNQAFLHARFATELDQYLHTLNERPKSQHSLMGDFHRAWIDFGSSISKSADEFILQECIRGEKAGIREYEEKLNNGKFAPTTKLLLEGQLSAMSNNIAGIKHQDDLP
ncbi:chemotaxis protein [Salinimicrobium marinum]|uniref:Chemotaxis protein n=1 Tax=Salinimicrobium marinum TaxID=680283 RepID=A0A918SBM5_9FLAO|nr:PA2169 family four-helix-bundle protein [Salinimicrobium marinum]GHA31010.1 chemotaxis protein [Salinimicrobium marinum]